MDFLISSKKVSKCKDCNGSGYIPLKDQETSIMDGYESFTVEIGCKRCKGKGKVTEKVDLSLESLKEMINGLK